MLLCCLVEQFHFHSLTQAHIELAVEATNGKCLQHISIHVHVCVYTQCLCTGTMIKAVVIFAEGLFDGESHIV